VINGSETSQIKNDSLPEFLIQLIQGYSTQTRIASRIWIALSLASIFAIIPSKVKMPYGLNDVPASDFYPFGAALISILIVSYGSVHIQGVRVRKLIERTLNGLREHVHLPGNIDPQDALDSIISPSANRLAPIAQFLQGKFQFFPESRECSRFLLSLSIIFYILLKLLNFIVMFGLPGYALFYSFEKGQLFSPDLSPWNIPVYFFWFTCAMGLLTLVVLAYSDVEYSIQAFARIAKRLFSKNGTRS